MNDISNPFGIEAQSLAGAGAQHTAREIAQQADVWHEVFALLDREQAALDRFLAPILKTAGVRIILTGAGSSSFIGASLAPRLAQFLSARVEAIATTSMVSAPRLYLQAEVPTLLVSFARSGNSPESMAAVELCDQLVETRWHLVITCNAEGDLRVAQSGRGDTFVLTLPERSHDRGFAMTSSFSSMYLAAARAFGLVRQSQITGFAGQLPGFIARAATHGRQLLEAGAQRVVYLGSNVLEGIAREAALKLLELSDGSVVAASDSTLGFRHGPKTIVNGRTLVIVFLSNDHHSRLYDLDLLAELRANKAAARVLAVTARSDGASSLGDHFLIESMADAGDLELALPMLVFAQVFALLQSLALKLTPDNPNAAGLVNRVVQGVTIHPLG